MENSIIKADIKCKTLVVYMLIMYLILGASLLMFLGNFQQAYNVITGLPRGQSCEIGAILLIVFIVMFAWKLYNQELPEKCSLELTNDGINGRVKVIGSTTDLRLPIEQIGSLFVKDSFIDKIRGGKTLCIRSHTGVIKFVCVQNADEFVTAANKAIEDNKKTNRTAPAASVVQTTSNADELKKYKDLVDSGVITQEEFDAKKKQILGL